MKILFLTPHYIDERGGGSYATLSFIHAFAKIADELTILIPYRGKESIIKLPKNVSQVPIEKKNSFFLKVIGVLCGFMHRYSNIDKYVDIYKYDVVVFDTSMTSARLICRFKKINIPVITIHHNYQYEYLRDNVRFPMKLFSLFWCAKFERKAVRLSNLNLTLTKADEVLLKDHYGKGYEKFRVVGIFEYEHIDFSVSADIIEDNFVITGNLGAVQTEKSLIPWTNKYYPILQEVFPNSNLIIAGKDPSEVLLDVANKLHVKVIPNPVSMKPILEQAKYYICATSLGGGLKLRVMDGLKSGLPVLCHRVSARGYEPFVEKGIVIVYDSISSFRQALRTIKQNSWSKYEIINEYNKFFSFEKGVERLNYILNSLTE